MSKRLKYIILILILSFSIKLFIPIIESDVFSIIHIEYKGDIRYTKDDIVARLNDSLIGKPIIYINTKLIEDFIKNDVRIEDIKIKKKYPSELTVYIKETEIKAIRNNNDIQYCVDKKLRNVMSVEENNKYNGKQKYPILYYTDDQKEEIYTIFNNLLNSSFKNDISEIVNINNVWTVFLNDNIKLYVNKNTDVFKYDYAYKLKKTEIITEYIDIRFKDIYTK